MSKESNVAIIRKMWECFDNGDMETLSNLYATDMEYRLPGHHPIAGIKHGRDEVFAFFKELAVSNITVKMLKIGAFGEDRVVEVHHGHGEAKGAVMDTTNCSLYTIKDGQITKVVAYNGDQHNIDNFFNAVYNLKPIPERLEE